VPRCEGDAHQVRWFDVYSPKVFAAIGGLTGALLDRCLIIHMEKAQKGSVRKSTRLRALGRDGKNLVLQLEAYAHQATDALRQLYEAEPDCGYWPSITDREAELWGPLLTHARLAGPDAEARLLVVVDKFSEDKAEIKSADSKIAQTIALLDAISVHPDTTFTPSELISALIHTDAWGRPLAEAKGRDDESVRVSQAAKIGYSLRNFRLPNKKNGSGNKAYDREAAMACLAAHVPQNPPNSPQSPSMDPPEMQSAENNTSPEGTEATEGFGIQLTQDDKPNHIASAGDAVDSSNSPSTAAVGVLACRSKGTLTTGNEMVEGEI
jgi:hypothetical protein